MSWFRKWAFVSYIGTTHLYTYDTEDSCSPATRSRCDLSVSGVVYNVDRRFTFAGEVSNIIDCNFYHSFN